MSITEYFGIQDCKNPNKYCVVRDLTAEQLTSNEDIIFLDAIDRHDALNELCEKLRIDRDDIGIDMITCVIPEKEYSGDFVYIKEEAVGDVNRIDELKQYVQKAGPVSLGSTYDQANSAKLLYFLDRLDPDWRRRRVINDGDHVIYKTGSDWKLEYDPKRAERTAKRHENQTGRNNRMYPLRRGLKVGRLPRTIISDIVNRLRRLLHKYFPSTISVTTSYNYGYDPFQSHDLRSLTDTIDLIPKLKPEEDIALMNIWITIEDYLFNGTTRSDQVDTIKTLVSIGYWFTKNKRTLQRYRNLRRVYNKKHGIDIDVYGLKDRLDTCSTKLK